MLSPTQTTLYSASAGAGKTFALVKNFLALALSTSDPSYVRKLLAITFTKKATAEMKSRILRVLRDCVEGSESSGMGKMIREELQLNESQFIARCEALLHYILHHYGYLGISTIDAFSHRIIRTFALDLDLNPGFEVELDSDVLLSDAAEYLLSDYNRDPQLSALLLEFAMHLVEVHQESWNLHKLLKTKAFRLFQEASGEESTIYQNWSFGDFHKARKALIPKNEAVLQRALELGQQGMSLLKETGLDESCYPYQYLPKAVKLLAEGALDKSIDAWPKLSKFFDSEQLIKKGCSSEEKILANRAFEDWRNYFEEVIDFIENEASLYNLRELIRKDSFSFSLLQKMQFILQMLYVERNIIPISDINQLIAKELKKNPSAYIYERLGERYQHYFIDEFQDTSRMQWENLEPLRENAMAVGGTVMLVGDAKQAIYRFRNGDVDIFLDIMEKGMNLEYPYSFLSLQENYRSRPQIVNFNSDFFRICAKQLKIQRFEALYTQATQRPATKQIGGMVEIHNFQKFSIDGVSIPFSLWNSDRLCEIVKSLLEENIQPGSIAIIARNNKEIEVYQSLLTDLGIPSITEVGQSLGANEEVVFAIACLRLHFNREDKEAQQQIHRYLCLKGLIQQPSLVGREVLNSKGFKALQAYFPELKHPFKGIGLYDLIEYYLRAFQLLGKSERFVQTLLSECLKQVRKNGEDLASFLHWWEERGNNVKAMSGQKDNAIEILTIHKAKGLEFPIVIIPKIDWDISRLRGDVIWHQAEGESMDPFGPYPFPIEECVTTTYPPLQKEYEKRSNINHFDELNILYVGMTRAVDRAYFILGTQTPAKISSFFTVLLQNSEENKIDDSIYRWGTAATSLPPKEKEEGSENEEVKHLSEDWTDRIDISVRITEDDRTHLGTAFHEVASNCLTEEDVKQAMHNEKNKDLQILLTHLYDAIQKEEFKDFFGSNALLNERAICDQTGRIIRPDRVSFLANGSVRILDYKTGSPSQKHEDQLNHYVETYTAAGYTVEKAALLYL